MDHFFFSRDSPSTITAEVSLGGVSKDAGYLKVFYKLWPNLIVNWWIFKISDKTGEVSTVAWVHFIGLMQKFIAFLIYISLKQMLFSGMVIHLEVYPDENKHTEDPFSMLFFPPIFFCISPDTSSCNIFLLTSIIGLLVCLVYKLCLSTSLLTDIE